MSTNDTTLKNADVIVVALRDLQSLLVETISSDVVVIGYKTSMLLPAGENYGSTMLKVEALIKRKKNSAEEKMHFVAKMIPPTEHMRQVINTSASFTKEIHVFEKLSQYYRNLEREAGVKEENLINIFPKFYGARLKINKKSPDKADEDTVMLLENLKTRGYDTMDRFQGLDYEHARLVITELARYHALGMALKYKKPALFAESRKSMNDSAMDMNSLAFDDMANHMLRMLCSDPRISKYEDRVRNSILSKKSLECFVIREEVEPWVTIIHGDVWVNNILFHHAAENGKVDDVKFVDYQAARICSPLKDLPYFLCASNNGEVIDKHFDQLIDAYYKKFIEVLRYCGCDVSHFTKKNFEEQLNKDAQDELFHCVFVLKFMTLEGAQDVDMSDIQSSIMMSGASKLYLDRSWKIVSKFIEKGWI